MVKMIISCSPAWFLYLLFGHMERWVSTRTIPYQASHPCIDTKSDGVGSLGCVSLLTSHLGYKCVKH